MTTGYARCRCCGTSYSMTPDIPLDDDGVCDGCRAEVDEEESSDE